MAMGMCPQTQDCQVDVYLESNLAMPKDMLLDARLQATRMFREIDVKVHMRDGSPARNPRTACGSPIVVSIETTTRYPVPGDALAYALPYQGSGTCIHVFLDRVLPGRKQPLANALLAHVMVHEITHVLEQIDRHSAEGVMKAHWSTEDYKRIERNPLPFAAEDVELIRTGLAKRSTRASAE